MRLNVQVEE